MRIFPHCAKPLCSIAHRMKENTSPQDLFGKSRRARRAEAEDNILRKLITLINPQEGEELLHKLLHELRVHQHRTKNAER